MNHLPLSDVPMLVSTINCLLRDKEFDNLDDICGYYEVDRTTIDELLHTHGYQYMEQYNKVI